MTQSLTIRQEAPAPAEVAGITASWPGLLQRQISGQTERDQIAAAVDAITVPASRAWIMARIASLLTGYYAADVPASIVKMDAEDWADELGDNPEWAIQAAVRWWRSKANPDRRKRPQPGDIAARIKIEMGVVSVARLAIDRFDRGSAFLPKQEPRQPVDRNRANEIVAEAGFAPRRFPEE